MLGNTITIRYSLLDKRDKKMTHAIYGSPYSSTSSSSYRRVLLVHCLPPPPTDVTWINVVERQSWHMQYPRHPIVHRPASTPFPQYCLRQSMFALLHSCRCRGDDRITSEVASCPIPQYNFPYHNAYPLYHIFLSLLSSKEYLIEIVLPNII